MSERRAKTPRWLIAALEILSKPSPKGPNPMPNKQPESQSEVERVALQKACGIPNIPTPLTYDLRRAVNGEGPLAYQWADKPHRLLYDACSQIEALSTLPRDPQGLVEALEWVANNSDYGSTHKIVAEAALAKAKDRTNDQ